MRRSKDRGDRMLLGMMWMVVATMPAVAFYEFTAVGPIGAYGLALVAMPAVIAAAYVLGCIADKIRTFALGDLS